MVRRAPWIALVLLILPARAGTIDPEALPPEQKENYEAFRVRCSKCHTLTKPLNVTLTGEGWRRYVEKMKRRPGSGISDQNGDKIVAFLIYKDAPAAAPADPADAGER